MRSRRRNLKAMKTLLEMHKPDLTVSNSIPYQVLYQVLYHNSNFIPTKLTKKVIASFHAQLGDNTCLWQY